MNQHDTTIGGQSDSPGTIDDLRKVFGELTDLHNWSGLQTPRNMTLALTARVGAVAGHLQFASDDTPEPASDELRAELADCLVYLLTLSDAAGVDLVDEAVRRVSSAVATDRAQVQP